MNTEQLKQHATSPLPASRLHYPSDAEMQAHRDKKRKECTRRAWMLWASLVGRGHLDIPDLDNPEDRDEMGLAIVTIEETLCQLEGIAY